MFFLFLSPDILEKPQEFLGFPFYFEGHVGKHGRPTFIPDTCYMGHMLHGTHVTWDSYEDE